MSALINKAVALIPAFNEEDKIVATLSAVSDIADVSRIIVIDDGSKDRTAELAEKFGAELGVKFGEKYGAELGAELGDKYDTELAAKPSKATVEVLRLTHNCGKGAALQLGADHLLSLIDAGLPAPSAVLLLDGDLCASAREAENLLYPVSAGLADMTIGVLPVPAGSGGFGVVKDLARREIRELGGGYNAQAPLSGQRAISWQCFKAVLPFAHGYGVEVALTIRALRRNFRVLEVMVEMYHRTTGKTLSGFIHRGKQYIDVYRTIQQLAKEKLT